MDKIVRLPFKKISEWLICICLGLLLIASLLPVVRLSVYAFPYYDDFNYGNAVKYAFEHGAGFTELIKAATDYTKIVYDTWQGTYASVFLMSLMPASFGYGYYYLGILVIIAALVMGTLYLTYTISTCFFGAGKIRGLNLALFVTFMNVELFYEAQQGIYWYNAAIHYTFMHSIMFIMLAEVIRILFCPKKSLLTMHIIFSSLLAAIVAGANFVTALQGILMICFVFVVGLFVKKKRAKFIIAPAVVFFAGLMINILAPGNESRKASYAGVSKGPIEAVVLSFASAFKKLWEFTGFPFLALFVALIPIAFCVGLNAKGKFRLPGLMSLLSFCFYATGFTPSWYGMGEEGLARTFCAIKLVLIILVAFNLVYWAGWLSNRLSQERLQKVKDILEHRLIIYLFSFGVFMVSFAVSKNQAGNFLSYGAYYYVHTGEALNYYNEHLVMDTLIKEAGEVVELEPFIWRPWFLCKKNEIDTNPDFEQNKALAQWYKKAQIYTRE